MSLDIALSGIHAINAQLDTISNNIANSSTFGFKSGRANFSALYAGDTPTGAQLSSITQSIGLSGNALATGGAMDVAIQGRGFFVSHDEKGVSFYSRLGSFSTDKNGFVVDGLGRKAQGFASIPGSTVLGAMGDLQVPPGQLAAQASTKLSYVGNMSSDWVAPSVAPFDPTNAQTFNSSVVSVLYDSLGAQHTMTQYLVKTGGNQVTSNYTIDGVATGASTVLDFNTSGALTGPIAPVTVALGTPTNAAPLSIAIDYTGTTQFSGEAITTSNAADGYTAGALSGVKVDAKGQVLATYTNGQKATIGTLAIAAFPNENALVPVSDTSWVASNGTGSGLYFTAGTGMAGTLTAGSLEQSNVDITTELVSLMSAQRNYQANSKVISTESATLQSLMQAL